jgi:hypothetical protein
MPDILRAKLLGSNCITACDITCKGRTPILTLCRSVASIGDGARLTVTRRHPRQATALCNLPAARNPPAQASAHEKLVSARSPSPHPLSPRAGKARQDDLRRTLCLIDVGRSRRPDWDYARQFSCRDRVRRRNLASLQTKTIGPLPRQVRRGSKKPARIKKNVGRPHHSLSIEGNRYEGLRAVVLLSSANELLLCDR